ncbi:MAG: thioester domain-containing protein [Solirubrobacteraceae bacterium]|nr:thioester domain-containing protein [Solirubrobacteraceae bacterium]
MAAAAPTEISQEISLQEGAQAGIVQLTSKGGFSGDVMAVDLTGARLPGKPVTVQIRIEFHGVQKDGQPWPQSMADKIAAGIEGRLSGLKGKDGTPLSIDVIPTVRPDAQPATPGTHQIELKDFPPNGDTNFIAGVVQPGDVHTGVFGVNEQPIVYAHETLHILGFHDRYLALQPDALIDGKRYPLPKFTGDKSDPAQLDAWFQKVTDAEKALEAKLGKKSDLVPGVPKGHELDLLANTHDDRATVQTADIDALIARTGTRLKAKPGDVLLGKDPTAQNLGVGAPLDLYAPKGGKAHADGIWAYCLDLGKHSPPANVGYDVLGPAAGVGGPQWAAIQRLLEAAGAHPDALASRGPSGAQDAIWAVTDASSPATSGEAFLAAAGVPFDKPLYEQTPHFTSPNAGNPATAGVTTAGGVLPAIPADAATPPVGTIDGASVQRPRALAVLVPKRLRLRGKRTPLRVSVVLERGNDQINVILRRKGKKGGRVLAVVPAPIGPSELRLTVPRVAAGRYRLELAGSSGWKRARDLRIAARRS